MLTQLLATTGILGTLLIISGYFLWRSSVSNKVVDIKHDLELDTLNQKMEEKNAQIKILSDKSDIDVKQLFADGEF